MPQHTANLVLQVTDFNSLGELLLAFGLTSSRLVTILTFMPVFTELSLPLSLRFAGALALSAPLLPMVDSALIEVSLRPWSLLLLISKEVVVGLVVLLIIGVPFWVVGMAGDIIEIQRGLGNESWTDPNNLIQSQATGRLLFLLFLLFVIANDGLIIIFHLIYESYTVVPIGDFPDIAPLIASLLRSNIFDILFSFAILIALPALIMLTLSDLAVALLSRFAQQLSILQLSLVIKGLIAMVGLVFYSSVLQGMIEPLLTDMVARFRGLAP